MYFRVERNELNAYVTVLEHRGVELKFDMRYVETTGAKPRGNFANSDFTPIIERLYDDLNSFMTSQLTSKEHDQLFAAYTAVANENMIEESEFQPVAREIYNIITLSKIHKWVVNCSDIHPSKNIKDVYVKEDTNPRDRTYVVEDYNWLAALAIALRAMVPIWGEWDKRTGILQSGGIWKEYTAVSILNETLLMTDGPTTGDILPPVEKLRLFIDKSIVYTDALVSTISTGGIGTEEFPDWVFCVILVRRVSVGELRNNFNNPKHNVCLVASIYKYIINRITQIDKTLGGTVEEKEPESKKKIIDENTISKMESYREGESTPPNLISRTDTFLEDPYRIAQAMSRYSSIHPGEFNEDTLRASIKSVEALRAVDVGPVQLRLLQWVSSLLISPRLINHMERDRILNLLTLQAFLIDHGHNEIAAVMTATPYDAEGGNFDIGFETHSNRLDASLSARLRECYANARLSVLRKSGVDARSPIDECLNRTANQIKERPWELTIPKQYQNFQRFESATKVVYLATDIKKQLAELAICIAERKF